MMTLNDDNPDLVETNHSAIYSVGRAIMMVTALIAWALPVIYIGIFWYLVFTVGFWYALIVFVMLCVGTSTIGIVGVGVLTYFEYLESPPKLPLPGEYFDDSDDA